MHNNECLTEIARFDPKIGFVKFYTSGNPFKTPVILRKQVVGFDGIMKSSVMLRDYSYHIDTFKLSIRIILIIPMLPHLLEVMHTSIVVTKLFIGR